MATEKIDFLIVKEARRTCADIELFTTAHRTITTSSIRNRPKPRVVFNGKTATKTAVLTVNHQTFFT
jgi:hypothetical protein